MCRVRLRSYETGPGVVGCIPDKDIKELGCHQRALAQNYKIRIYEVPWTIPPNSWHLGYI